MNKNATNSFAPRLLITLATVACSLAALTAHAQQVYRIIGADGRTTFSDKPPAESNAKVSAESSSASGSSNGAILPFELRQVASRYPVTLYTGDSCVPCGSARTLLMARGVPFSEKTISSNDDIQALQRMSGETSLPFATIGGQQLKGYSDVEWSQFLDAAGYPKRSVLPPSYRQAAATPLVAAAPVPKAAVPADSRAAAARPAAAPAAPTTGPSTSNPAGIRF